MSISFLSLCFDFILFNHFEIKFDLHSNLRDIIGQIIGAGWTN